MTDPNGAAILMVCHGSHQYTPVMLAYIPAPWMDPSWVTYDPMNRIMMSIITVYYDIMMDYNTL